MSNNALPTTAVGVSLAPGPYGQPNGAYSFPGISSGYIAIPKQVKTDTRYNMSFFTWIYNQGTFGPILNYETYNNKWGLHVYIHSPSVFYVSLITRDNANDDTAVTIDHAIARDTWTFVGFTYDYSVGKVRIYINGMLKKEKASPKHELNTNFKIKIGGAKYAHSDQAFPGRLSCFQIYNVVLTELQVKDIKRYCRDVIDIYTPCLHHGTIDVSNRLLDGKIAGHSPDKVTISLTRWYQLPGKRILSTCPSSSSCGAKNPGWLNGRYPSVEDGIKKMELCYRKGSDCCWSKGRVLVRQCYGYFVFKFDEFPAEGRFCTEPDPFTHNDVMFISTNERCLPGQVFYSVDDVKEAHECVGYCLSAGSQCRSVNYIAQWKGRCELNNATRSEGSLREDSKCSYYEMS